MLCYSDFGLVRGNKPLRYCRTSLVNLGDCSLRRHDQQSSRCRMLDCGKVEVLRHAHAGEGNTLRDGCIEGGRSRMVAFDDNMLDIQKNASSLYSND